MIAVDLRAAGRVVVRASTTASSSRKRAELVDLVEVDADVVDQQHFAALAHDDERLALRAPRTPASGTGVTV